MSPLRKWTIAAAVALAAAGAGLMVARQQQAEHATQVQSGAALVALQLADMDGRTRSLAEWKDKVVVVNFWATWCAPCREEMPEFSRISQEYAAKGVQFVGIGIDTPVNVQKFIAESPVAYPLLVGAGDAMQAAATIGNTLMALPFTAVLNRQGQVVQTKLGKMQRPELESAIRRALAATR